MYNYFQDLLQGTSNTEFIKVFILMMLLFFTRHLIVRGVSKLKFKNAATKLKILYVVKNFTLLIILFIFIFIWGEELRSLALSLAAVAVAFVIALKEVILCIVGGILKASSKLFEIGDRINIKGIRGEISDHNLLLTTLLEIGPGENSNQYTGKLVKIPNSLFLSESFYTTPAGNPYVLNVLKIPASLDKNIFKKQELLLKAAQAVLAPYENLAQEYIEKMCEKQSVELPNLSPTVLYDIIDSEKIEFHVRMPMPFTSLTKTENKIKDLYLNSLFRETSGY